MPNTIEATLTGSTGPAFIERNGEKIALNEGDSIYEADLIITGPETTIDISYRDGTKSRIGPDSEMRLVDFEFGPSEEPSFIVNLTQGAMRTVSGDIVKLNPEAFEVITPRATVGIRGTEFITQVGEESETHAVLYIKDGHIMMVTKQDGSSVTFDKPLQMTTVSEHASTLQTKEYSFEQMQDLMNALAPSFGNNLPRNESEQGNFPTLERKRTEEKEEEEEEEKESNNQDASSVNAENQENSESGENSEQTQNSFISQSTDQALEEALRESNGVDIVYDNEANLNTLLAALKEAGIQVNSALVASAKPQIDRDFDTDTVIDHLREVEFSESNSTNNNTENNTDKDRDKDNDHDNNIEINPPQTRNFTDFDGDNLVLGNGNDSITITNEMKSGSIHTGAGDDFVSIGTVIGDTITNYGSMTGGSINTGTGDDTLTITFNMTGGTINMGEGNNTLSLCNITDGTVNLGSGNDTISVYSIAGNTTIDAGNGNNSINITNQSGGTISTGNGNDTIIVTDQTGGTISTGEGNDLIIVGSIADSTINGGEGFDILVTETGTPTTKENIEVSISGTSVSSVNDLLSLGITVDSENELITLDASWTKDQNDSTLYTSGTITLTVSSDAYIDTVNSSYSI